MNLSNPRGAVGLLGWLSLLLISTACTMPASAEKLAMDAEASADYGFTRSTTPVAGLAFGSSEADSLAERPSGKADDAQSARMLVREASLRMRVARGGEAVESFEAMVEERGGYVLERNDLHVVARVPADAFDAALDAVRAMGQVLSESVRAQDVTEQHRDLTIRLENARKSRERLLALLERAEKIEDVVKIESELRRLTTEIERMTAQLEALDLRVATSLLEVEFEAPDEIDVPAVRRNVPSRFRWINFVGPRHVLDRF